MKLLATLVVWGLIAFIAPVARAQDRTVPTCVADVRDVVAAALQHSLEDAKDLRDLGVLAQRPIYILDYVSENDCVLGKAVLPTSIGEMYALVSRGQLSELARHHRDGVAYVRAGGIEINDGQGQLWLGISIQQPPGDKRPLVCCCGGQIVFRRAANNWQFVEWKNVSCA